MNYIDLLKLDYSLRRCRNLSLIKKLIKKGADINLIVDGKTPLEYILSRYNCDPYSDLQSYPKIAEYLYRKGSKINLIKFKYHYYLPYQYMYDKKFKLVIKKEIHNINEIVYRYTRHSFNCYIRNGHVLFMKYGINLNNIYIYTECINRHFYTLLQTLI